MLVPQGNPDAIVVFFRSTCCTPSDAGAAVFQNGQQLPSIIAPATLGCPGATYAATPDMLWCQDSEDTGSGIFQLHLDGQGIHAASSAIYLVGTDFHQIPTFYQSRLFINTFGSVVDPVQNILLALPDWVGAAIRFDYDLKVAGLGFVLKTIDQNRRSPLAWLHKFYNRDARGHLEGPVKKLIEM
jgi:hypothetical protein